MCVWVCACACVCVCICNYTRIDGYVYGLVHLYTMEEIVFVIVGVWVCQDMHVKSMIMISLLVFEHANNTTGSIVI